MRGLVWFALASAGVYALFLFGLVVGVFEVTR